MVTIMEDHEDLLVVMVGQDPAGGQGGGHGALRGCKLITLSDRGEGGAPNDDTLMTDDR